MDPGEPTLSAMAARLISMAVARHGVAPSDLCARVGIAPEALADVDGRVGVRPMIALSKLSPWSTPSCVSCELRRRTRVPSSWSEPKNPRVQGRAVRRVRSRVYFTVAVKLSM